MLIYKSPSCGREAFRGRAPQKLVRLGRARPLEDELLGARPPLSLLVLVITLIGCGRSPVSLMRLIPVALTGSLPPSYLVTPRLSCYTRLSIVAL